MNQRGLSVSSPSPSFLFLQRRPAC